MKKILLISVAFWGIPVMAQAETDLQCQQFGDDWCDNHGYKEEVCLSGYTCIKCPLNLSQVYNHRSQVKNCEVGDILWNDNNCYVLDITNGNITNAPDNLQPKAVVFDDVNKLAVQVKPRSSTQPFYHNIDEIAKKWQYSGVSGFTFLGNDGPKLFNFTIDADKQLCSANARGQGGSATYHQYGCKLPGVTAHKPATFYMSEQRTTTYNRRGWDDTFKIVNTASGSSFSFPAAVQCYSKNINSADVLAGHVWFLPSVGDLKTLGSACPHAGNNRNNCIADASAALPGTEVPNGYVDYDNTGTYWSSTQGYKNEFGDEDRDNGNKHDYYSYAVAVSGTNETVNCNVRFVPRTIFDGRNAQNNVWCVYHYGDDWDMSSYAALWAGQTQGQQQAPLDDDNTAAAN